MNLGKTLLALSMVLVTAGAHATVTDWGVHDDVEFGFGYGAGAFSDVFSFTLPVLGEVSASAVSTVLKPKVGPFWGDVKLYEGVYGSAATLLGGFSFGPNTAYNFYTMPGLEAGSYYYEVSGVYKGKGSYALDSEFMMAVPEPETYMLLFAGLGIVVASRRYKKG